MTDFDQQLISSGMADGVVDILEPVQVNIEEGTLFVGTVLALDFLLEGIFKKFAIEQFG